MELIEELPESRIGQVIDFIEFIIQRKDQEIHIEEDEGNDLRKQMSTEDKVSGQDVNTLFGV